MPSLEMQNLSEFSLVRDQRSICESVTELPEN